MTRLVAGRAAAALLLCVCVTPAALAEGPLCSIPQSPRNIDPKTAPYDGTSTTSIVAKVEPDSIVYVPRAGGPPQTLWRCGQHYHFPIEDPQGCPGEIPPGAPGEEPQVGQWVEIHTVYAAKACPCHDCCDPESLSCCLVPPFLVRAFAAKVTAGGSYQPIEPPPGRSLAEWSGSTTGVSTPEECKPAAQWSFRLSCDFTVSEAQLGHFQHADPARRLQHGPRLSKDLTLVVP